MAQERSDCWFVVAFWAIALFVVWVGTRTENTVVDTQANQGTHTTEYRPSPLKSAATGTHDGTHQYLGRGIAADLRDLPNPSMTETGFLTQMALYEQRHTGTAEGALRAAVWAILAINSSEAPTRALAKALQDAMAALQVNNPRWFDWLSVSLCSTTQAKKRAH